MENDVNKQTPNFGYEDLAQAPLGDNIMAQIAGVARDILAAQQAVEDAGEVLKQKQQALRVLQEDVLPELMANAGQLELTTIDGLKVTVKELVRGGPSKEREAAAWAWLKANGQGGVIKSQVAVDIGKGNGTVLEQAVDALEALGLRVAAKETVHNQTLLAVVRELLERGEAVPLDLLGIHQWKQAEVKPVKTGKPKKG